MKGIKMAKTHKPHVVQTEKIDTSSMTKKELAKYLPDADGTPIQRRCVVCTGWFLVRKDCPDKKTCCGRCTLCYEHGGPDYDYDIALKWKYEQQRRSYKAKTGYDNPSQNPKVKAKVSEAFDRRYGDGTPGSGRSERMKQIMRNYQERTGYVNPSQDPEVLKKVRETRAKNYGDGDLDKANKELYRRRSKSYKEKTGYENPGQNPEVKAKVHDTVMDRYGVDNVFQDDDVKRRIVATTMERYGVPYVTLLPEVREKTKKDLMERYGVPYCVMIPEVQKSSGSISKLNLRYRKSLEEWLPDHKIDIEKSFGDDVNGKPRKADLTVVGTNVLIDLNPTISHNSTIGYRCFKGLCSVGKNGAHSECGGVKAVDYQLSRCEEAQKSGWRLFQFYDWDDESRILNYVRNVVKGNIIDLNDCDPSWVTTNDQDDVKKFVSDNTIHSGLRRGNNGRTLRFCDKMGIMAMVCKVTEDNDELIVSDFITKDQRPMTNVVSALKKAMPDNGSVKRLTIEKDLDLDLPCLTKDEEELVVDSKVHEKLVWAHPSRKTPPMTDVSVRIDHTRDYPQAVEDLLDKGMTRMYTAGVESVTFNLQAEKGKNQNGA